MNDKKITALMLALHFPAAVCAAPVLNSKKDGNVEWPGAQIR
jgi:hypothetical protein